MFPEPEGKEEVKFLLFVIKKAEDEKQEHSDSHIAVGYVELREIDGDEINKVYHISVGNPVDQVAGSAADKQQKGDLHGQVAFSFRHSEIFKEKEEHNQ